MLLKTTFRPEFLNRVDEVITFNRLGKDQILTIVDIQLMQLEERLAERKISIQTDGKAKQFIADQGYDPLFGARPLKRAIQNLVQNPLAKKLLQEEYKDGDVIAVTKGKNELEFTLIEHSAAGDSQ